MIFCDYHVHTNFCDGRSTPEEIVLSAIVKGIPTLGFATHSYLDFDQSYCIKREDVPKYKADVAELKERYGDRIRILCGVEQDLFSVDPADGFDYIIGSVHHFKGPDRYYTVDYSADELRAAAENICGGDMYALAEIYYSDVAKVVDQTNADIIGHFDLISKLNKDNAVFDESHPRYVAAWKKAADSLLKTGKPFEVNCGAISRGYRDTPYPARPILTYLCENGARVILTGDSHHKDTLCYQFDRWYPYLLDIGFDAERIITL